MLVGKGVKAAPVGNSGDRDDGNGHAIVGSKAPDMLVGQT